MENIYYGPALILTLYIEFQNVFVTVEYVDPFEFNMYMYMKTNSNLCTVVTEKGSV